LPLASGEVSNNFFTQAKILIIFFSKSNFVCVGHLYLPLASGEVSNNFFTQAKILIIFFQKVILSVLATFICPSPVVKFQTISSLKQKF
jgi:hypothetical protein